MADDPDMLELVEEFVENLKNRVKALEKTLAEENLSELQRLTHQLKGASGGYGFDLISEVAADVESIAKSASSTSEVAEPCRELISICKRATAGPAPTAR
jgi:HPt (histidine-containing phosphotransfer) domain-containing protein